MNWVTMSERDLRRIGVLSEVLAERRTVVSAAAVLALSVRQTHRLLIAYRDGGGGALVHKARGRVSNNRFNTGIQQYATELIIKRHQKTIHWRH